jgi:hypothetical protein
MTDGEDDYVSPEESGLSSLVAVTVTPVAVEELPQPSAAATTPVSDPPSPGTGGGEAAWEAYKARDRSRKLPEPVQMPDGWSLHDVAALVGDVAANMYELPFILAKHKLSEAQYNLIKKNEFFQRALEAEIITWQGANSIQKRLALEAAIAVEASMPMVAARLSNKNEPLGEVVSLMKLFAEMAGSIGTKAAPTMGNSERFKIVINLGGHNALEREAEPALKVVTGTVTP